MKKRILSVLLSIIFVLSSMPVITASAKKGYVARQTSDLGVGFIEAFEGYYQFQYWDYEHYTIGYGSTCEKDEYPGGISEAFAHKLLKKNLPSYESGLNDFLKSNNIYVTQNQYDALISFTYNFGAYVWKTDVTLGNYLKKGIENYTDKQIADAFGLWVKAGGVVLQGLVDRRKAEAEYFCTADYGFNKEVYVVTDSINMRSGAGSSYSSLGSLKRGDRVIVTEKKYISDTAWGKITRNKKTGWICLDYTKYGNDQTNKTNLIATCLYKTENVPTGIMLKWKKVKGATGYKIYRKAGNSTEYSLLKTITKNSTVSYIDTGVSQQKYSYYVVSYNAKKDANKSGVCEISFVSAPKIKSLKKVSNGFKLTWAKKSGASKYKVMRSNEDDDTLIPIATVTTTSYTDTKAVGGVKYYYSVKAVTSSGISGAPEAKQGIYLSSPEIISSSNTKNSIKINWSCSLRTGGYYVYRKGSNETQTKLVKTITDASTKSYTDKNVKQGISYTYKVKAYSGELNSAMSAGYTTMLYVPPTINSISAKTNGIALTWSSAAGAAKYNIYRRPSSSSEFTKIATTSSTSYTDKTVTGGVKYYYRLTSVASNGTESYKGGAKSCTCFIATSIKSSKTVKTGITINFAKVSNAKSYSVYSYSGGVYTLLKTVTGTSYTDSSFGENLSKTYAVKVNYEKGSSNYSSKFKAYRLGTPELTVTKTSTGLMLNWNQVKNAKGVIIYRKVDGGKFEVYSELNECVSPQYENTKVTKGKTYSYKIKVTTKTSVSMASNVVTMKFTK